jgi:hypothetical protein
VQDLVSSFYKLCAARVARLLLRFPHLRRGLRVGAVGLLSRILVFLLVEGTNAYGVQLPPAADKTQVCGRPLPSWSSLVIAIIIIIIVLPTSPYTKPL